MHYFHIQQKEANKPDTEISAAETLHVLMLIKGFNRAGWNLGCKCKKK